MRNNLLIDFKVKILNIHTIIKFELISGNHVSFYIMLTKSFQVTKIIKKIRTEKPII